MALPTTKYTNNTNASTTETLFIDEHDHFSLWQKHQGEEEVLRTVRSRVFRMGVAVVIKHLIAVIRRRRRLGNKQ